MSHKTGRIKDKGSQANYQSLHWNIQKRTQVKEKKLSSMGILKKIWSNATTKWPVPEQTRATVLFSHVISNFSKVKSELNHVLWKLLNTMWKKNRTTVSWASMTWMWLQHLSFGQECCHTSIRPCLVQATKTKLHNNRRT